MALQQSLRDLNRAYQNFFAKRAKHPKFKAKYDGWQSYRTNNQGNNIRIEHNKIKLPKVGWVKVDKWYPSTKTCSSCGHIKPMKLSERVYCCPKCGQILDRDFNAAINIRREAIRMVGACIA